MIFVAWRILTHEIGRSSLAVGGVFIAILMVFLQIGFFSSIPVGGMTVYDKMSFDIMLTSSSYVFQGQSYDFPRQRIYQALALPEVESVAPVYQDSAQWYDEQDGWRRDVFVMGFRLRDHVFDDADVNRKIDILQQPDTVLVDSASYPIFGSITPGRVTEIGDRTVTIGGRYVLGIGFLGLGVVLASDQNFIRMFPNRTLAAINLGLVRLKPGADPDRVAAELRGIMPADTRVFTRAELASHEAGYWMIRTSTGAVFGFGALVAIIVGAVILYQTLSTQVARQLPQYATLKAMGYSDRYLGGIVVSLAMLMAGIAFIPAIAASIGVYRLIHNATALPVQMTQVRLVMVLAITLFMAAGSALYAVRGVRRADPVDLF
jgi:putative ABC transport system permease protein